jgi:hypothetical protein
MENMWEREETRREILEGGERRKFYLEWVTNRNFSALKPLSAGSSLWEI